MKSIRYILILLLVVFCLTACGTPQAEDEVTISSETETTQEPTSAPLVYEEGTALAWVDISGLTVEEALDTVAESLSDYRFTLSVNGTPLTFTAEELGMQLNIDALQIYLAALQNGEPLPSTALAACKSDVVINQIRRKFQWGPANPTIVYSDEAKQFLIRNGQRGQIPDTNGISQVVTDAIGNLSDSVVVQIGFSYPEPAVADSDPILTAAQAQANSYLLDGLTYYYEAEGIESFELPITLAEQAAFLSIGSDYSVSINEKAISNYVDNVAKTHIRNVETDAFITSMGYSLPSYQVPYHTVTLDKGHLRNDIQYCLENGITGLRNALLEVGESFQKPYGGTYVEVSIDDQHLWYYKDGTLLVSCDVVTGKVSAGWNSRTGIFEVNNKARNINLVGYDYVTPVDYWIAYIGQAVGLHDAKWHDTFGGDIFIYKGTHGCINMPYDAVVTVYENITIGTPVIVYGNTKSIVNQEFGGASDYTVELGTEPFKLDVAPKYEKAPLSYSSNNNSVVTVDENGMITVVGTGTATITVKSDAWWNVREGKHKVTITVLPEPEPEPEPDPLPDPEPEETT